MKIGFVGLGKMGYQIVKKMVGAGHEMVVFDVDSGAVARCADFGAIPATSRQDLVEKLGANPIVWLMIPSSYSQAEIQAFADILPTGGTLIDGGNTNYQQTLASAEMLASKRIHMLDVGTSGGVLGLQNGFSLMIGGEQDVYTRLVPAFQVLAAPNGGYSYMGPSASGHYVKMVHNGIEYGVMQAIAEGFDLLKAGPLVNIPLCEVADVWQRGSIIQSTLNGLVQEIMHENPSLDGVDGYVADSGEGRWTLETAEQAGVNMPVLEQSINVRRDSQNGQTSYSTKLLAAMRNKFGGHAINKQA